MMRHTFTVGHFYCGIGGKALGFAQAVGTFAGQDAMFETIGGVDIDPLACLDFETLTGAPALCADVHQIEPADLIAFFGPSAPDVIAMSPPCKGFSALLSAKRALEPQYQRMNELMERALFLVAATWDVPPRVVFVENVPRITKRGADTLRRCVAIGSSHGYAIAMGTHDCGELGGLAQHRKRWFMIWRHRGQLGQVVYQPVRHRVRACGEVLGPLPMPGDTAAGGPMHQLPGISWRNCVRLALIPAGGDWRDLEGVLADGQERREVFRRNPVAAWEDPAATVTGPGGSAAAAVADPRGVDLGENPGRHWNKYTVTGWDDPARTITGTDGRVGSGAPSVADPRFGHVDRVTPWGSPIGTVTRSPAPSSGAAAVADPRWGGGRLGVAAWDAAAATVTGESLPTNGSNAVADPRISELVELDGEHRNDDLGVLAWADPSSAVTGQSRPRNGRFSVADPRPPWQHVAGVTSWDSPAPTVTGRAKIHTGAFQVADPRIVEWLGRDDVIQWLSFRRPARRGVYGVMRWQDAAATITGGMSVDTGRAAVADPRFNPDRAPPFTPVIIAADGTWHRPLTTLELAVLQSLPSKIGGRPLVLAGSGHTRWREAIGNMVPPLAARGVGEQLLVALLVGKLGAFALGATPMWVSPQAVIA